MSFGIIKNCRTVIKFSAELSYWKLKNITKDKLNNSHYNFFYTTYFSIPPGYYKDKVILDIGCGPRGSLEWANMAKKRIGIDPLADKYLKMGASEHNMEYIKGYSENIPFQDNYFDVICSFNSLDHVNNLAITCNEINRTLKRDGIFLLIVDIHKRPTLTEPQTISWDFIEKYFPNFLVLEENHLESIKKWLIYSNVRKNVPIKDERKQKGVLTAKLKKNV